MAPNTKTEVAAPGDDSYNSSPSLEVKEILYDGYYYDVTHFIKKHPGGSIIEYYVAKGEDATHAMQQFHHRSLKKIKVMLQSFKKRPATDRRCKF
jgi:hypothetical protein